MIISTLYTGCFEKKTVQYKHRTFVIFGALWSRKLSRYGGSFESKNEYNMLFALRTRGFDTKYGDSRRSSTIRVIVFCWCTRTRRTPL